MISLSALISLVLKRWPLVALLSSALMLALAHGFELFANLAPCPLCLHQREVYWTAICVSLLALLVERMASNRLALVSLNLLLSLTFAAGVMIAGFHAGVEFKWWPGLAECGLAKPESPISGSDLLGALSKSMDVPACDKVAWSFLGISMAGWNMLVSLKLTIWSLIATFAGQQKSEGQVALNV